VELAAQDKVFVIHYTTFDVIAIQACAILYSNLYYAQAKH